MMNKNFNLFKNFISVLLALIVCFSLSGCWNYRGLNEITIVSGMAIDKDESGENYKLTFETVDLSKPSKDNGMQSKIIESEGKTLLDAARNARKIPLDRLYFGNMPIVIVSQKIAREDGISDIIDWLLRDDETRETIHVIISKHKTAKEILTLDEKNKSVLSYEILSTIQKDNKTTSSTVGVHLYEAYNALNGEGGSLVLPSVCCRDNNGNLLPEIDGIAVFKKDKLIDFLSCDESHYYLIMTNNMHGGVFGFNLDENKQADISLQISNNKTKKSYSYQNGQFKLIINNKLNVILDELNLDIDVLDEKQIDELKLKCEKIVEENTIQLIKKSQNQFQTDIFRIGEMVYKKDPKLWEQLKDNWNETYKTMEVEVHTDLSILNTGEIKDKGD